ncbi:MAG: multidrug ABC transporter permease [Chloroflexi bacterium UTCFX4]|nr:MAG: multidrug ABC transporter permease [Chloroflexi bacterium UTCFX4]
MCSLITRARNWILEGVIVKLLEQGAPPDGWAKAAPIPQNILEQAGDFIRITLIVAELEVRKLAHDATDLVVRAIQPALWLIIFGQVFTQIRAIPTGDLSYIEFLAPGILAQSVLFISIFYGIAIIWERDLGILQKFLVSPAPRAALVMGKALSAGVRALSQAVIIYLLAFAMGVQINWNPLALLGVVLVVFLGASIFATFSLIVACIVKTRERFMGIGQVLTMPLFFASSAIYPIAIMPIWLQAIARVNPLTYLVDALRTLMLRGELDMGRISIDLGVLMIVMVVMIWLGARMYPRVAM